MAIFSKSDPILSKVSSCNFGIIIRLAIIVPLFIVLTIYTFPSSNASAQTCNPGSPSAGIRLSGEGFLSVVDSTAMGRFTFDVTPTPGITKLSICGSSALIPEFSLITYQEMKSTYFDQAKAGSKLEIEDLKPLGDKETTSDHSPINLAAASPSNKNTIYHISGNFTVSHDIDVKHTGVIFVDGDLLIKNDLTKDTNTTGLIFIVAGNVWIDENVKQVNAFIVVLNKFCSVSWGELPGVDCRQRGAAVTNPLVINGSVIFLNNPAGPTHPGKPEFNRSLVTGNSDPAETLNYQAKYLVITKKIFAKPRLMWTEVTDRVFTHNAPFVPTATPLPTATHIPVYGYRDADGDDYGAGIRQTFSGSLPAGYVANNTDCNDSNSAKWKNLTGYPDADSDGYYSSVGTTVCSGASLPAGYSASSGTDCYDSNANAKPGQTAWFTTSRGDGSFDYNCDNVTTKYYPISTLGSVNSCACVECCPGGRAGLASDVACGVLTSVKNINWRNNTTCGYEEGNGGSCGNVMGGNLCCAGTDNSSYIVALNGSATQQCH